MRCENLVHIEVEMKTLLEFARQFGDHIGHFDIPALPVIRQRNREAVLGLPCGVIKTEAKRESGKEKSACHNNSKS